jgi:hypothetical protein
MEVVSTFAVMSEKPEFIDVCTQISASPWSVILKDLSYTVRTYSKPSLIPRRRPGFESGSGHVEFVVDKVALEQVFSEYYGFPCQFSFHRLLHNHHPALVQ